MGCESQGCASTIYGEPCKEIERKRQKFTKWTETDRNGQKRPKRTERDRNGIETDINWQKWTEIAKASQI